MSPRGPRAIVVVLDSVGAGALPDAESYGDVGSNTLGNTARAAGGLRLPNLGRMGLGNITEILGVPPVEEPEAFWGKMAEQSAGKDTTTGHWEMMGIRLARPFPTYPDGFPAEVMEAFTAETGYGWLGNRAASGTVIIQELGDEHVATGKPIVYTSADSVFQIAAHEEVIAVDELYRICRVARERVLVGEHAVGRVIARPFVGPDASGTYTRTHRRRDFALPPVAPTVPDLLAEQGILTHGIGKIGEVFAWRGICDSPHVTDNMDALDKLVELVAGDTPGFVFANLVDFDMLWGHRNDAEGYARGLEAVDARLPELLGGLMEGDLLIITADHGCDPTTASTDHSREYAPLIACVKSASGASGSRAAGTPAGGSLGVRETFSDVGATIAEFYGLESDSVRGTSFLGQLRGE
ncbi:MAG: phosphopentomutase [Coriobacteriia bacterium]